MSKMRKSIHVLCYILVAVAIIIGYGIVQSNGNVWATSMATEYVVFTDENKSITYDAEHNVTSSFVSVPFVFYDAYVENPEVATVLTIDPLEYDENEGGELNPLQWDRHGGTVNRGELIPMAEGTTAVLFKGEEGQTFTVTVTVKSDYFASYLKRMDQYLGLYYTTRDVHGERDPHYNANLNYGNNYALAYGRYGMKVTIKLGGKTKTVTCNTNNVAWFTKLKAPLKIGTNGKVTYEFGPAKVTKKFKVVNGAKLEPRYIKKNAKKGIVDVYNLHKGDIVKIKVGKKTLRSYKVKKDASHKKITFKSKKKLKKNTKVKYYVYNKYKQKMTSYTYKVGKWIEWNIE